MANKRIRLLMDRVVESKGPYTKVIPWAETRQRYLQFSD